MIRAIQYGLGVAGCGIVRLLLERGIAVVGAVDADPGKVGRDAGEVAGVSSLGVTVTADAAALARPGIADVVFHATAYDPPSIVRQLLPFVAAGIDAVSVSGISYLPRRHPELARQLHGAARQGGATVVGVGLNPGFLQDLLPIVLSGACADVRRIAALRTTDFSPWGPEVIRHYGIGLGENAFRARVAEGALTLHAEILQSMDMIADALGWTLEDVTEEREPLVTATDRRGAHVEVRKGQVCGFRHRTRGFHAGRERLSLELCGVIHPDLSSDGLRAGTTVTIEGEPNMSVAIDGDLSLASGVYSATAARAVNALPQVRRARPGLTCIADLPVVRWWQSVAALPRAGNRRRPR